MKLKKIYTGTIRKCSAYSLQQLYEKSLDTPVSGYSHAHIESKVEKENAILIKIKNGKYVDIDILKTLRDYLNIYFAELSLPSLSIHPSKEGELFVDKDSLAHYSNSKDYNKQISLKKIKKKKFKK